MRQTYPVSYSPPINEPAASPAVTRRQPTWRYFVLAVLAYAILFGVWQREPVPYHVHAAAVLVAATSMLPLFIWQARGRPGLPMFELIALSYALQFSYPVYTQPRWLLLLSRVVGWSWDSVFWTLLTVELGLIALLAGYYCVVSTGLGRDLPRLDLPIDRQRFHTYLIAALLVGGLFIFFQRLGWGPFRGSAVAALSSLVANQFYIALILLTYELYRGKMRGPHAWGLLYLSLALVVALGMAGGMLNNAFMPLAMFVTARWDASGKFPTGWLIFGFFLFILLNPVKEEYRRVVWVGPGAGYSLAERIDLWLDLAQGSLTNMSQNDLLENEQVVYQATSRFNLLYKFVHVREMTPAIVPYYQGQTYEYFLYAWMPRIFWPGKPTATAANRRVDIDYGLVPPGYAGGTNIGIGQLPEAYANAGVGGMALIMFLQGIVLGAANSLLNRRSSEGGRAIYLSIMVFFLNGIGTSTVMVFGALFQQLLANSVILRLFAASGWRRDEHDAAIEKRAQPRRAVYSKKVKE